VVDTSRILVNRMDRLEANIVKFVWMRGSIHGASSRTLDYSDHGGVFYKLLILCN
jgi:hypothetical protein